MKVKEVIVVACNMIGEDSFAEKIKSGSTLNNDENYKKTKFERCFNLIQSELATEFFPLTKKEEISSTNGKFDLEALSEKIVYPISIKTTGNEELSFKIVGNTLEFDGKGVLEYCFEPKESSLDDKVQLLLPARLFAYGLLREYYLLEDMPTEASLMEEKYKNSILSLSSCKRKVKLPMRQWF